MLRKPGILSLSTSCWLLTAFQLSCGPLYQDSSLEGQEPVASEPVASAQRAPVEVTPGESATPEPDAPSNPASADQPPSWLSQPAAAYQRGEAMSYLPASCDEWSYIDLGAAVGSDATVLRNLVPAILRASLGAKGSVDAALKVLAKHGVDPMANVRELAVCENGSEELYALGFDTGKVLEIPALLQELSVAMGRDSGELRRQGDLSLLLAQHGIYAQPSPHVLLITRADELPLASITARQGGKDFAAAKGKLAFASKRRVQASIVQRGGVLEGSMTQRVDSTDKALKQGKKSRLELAASLKGTPLEPLRAPLEQITATAQDSSTVVLRGAVRRATLLSIVKTASDEGLDKLVSIF